MIPAADEIRAQVAGVVAEETAKFGTGDEEEHGKEEPTQVSVFAKIDWRDYTAGKLLDAPLPELTWTLLGFLLTGCVALLAGQPGTGKSMLSLYLAFLVACGRGLEGIFEPGGVRGRVLVLAGEEDPRIVPRRVRALRDHLFTDNGGFQDFNRDADEQALRENLIVIPLAGQSLRLLDRDGPGAPFTTTVYEELTALCKGIDNLQLIVIDPQSRFYGLDENDNSASTVYIEVLEKLACETGASIICLHHVGKGGKTWTDNLHQYAARGASGFVGAVRAQLNLVTLTKDEAKKVINPDEQPQEGEYLALGFAKCSYGPPRQPVFLHRLQGGVLELVEPNGRTAEDEQTETAILNWIKDKIKSQLRRNLPLLTIRMLGDFSAEWGGIFGASRSKVWSVANAAVSNGDLFLVPGKNASGRSTEYLSLEPSKEPSDGSTREPSREPSGFNPSEPSNPSKTGPTVLNLLDLQDVGEPSGVEPSDENGRIVTTCNHGSVEPSEPSSLKRESAAGFAGQRLSSKSVERRVLQ